MGDNATDRREADCIFCGIVAGEIPADRVHEDDQVIAFADRSPKAPLHVLVVPREHRKDVRELSESPELLAHTASVAATIASDQADGDFRLIFNTGASAGQTVFHVHAHVLAGGTLAESEM
jgi:histidine triad (HIT) family protein